MWAGELSRPSSCGRAAARTCSCPAGRLGDPRAAVNVPGAGRARALGVRAAAHRRARGDRAHRRRRADGPVPDRAAARAPTRRPTLLEHASAALEVPLGAGGRRRALRRACGRCCADARIPPAPTADLSRRHAVVEDPETGALDRRRRQAHDLPRAWPRTRSTASPAAAVPHCAGCRSWERRRRRGRAPRQRLVAPLRRRGRRRRRRSAPRSRSRPACRSARPSCAGPPRTSCALTPEDLVGPPHPRRPGARVARGGPGRGACHDPGMRLPPPSPPPTSTTSHELISGPGRRCATRASPEPPPDGLRPRLVRALRAGPRDRAPRRRSRSSATTARSSGWPSPRRSTPRPPRPSSATSSPRARAASGVASEALRQLTAWAFERRGIQRAYLLIDVGNAGLRAPSRERAGYTLEGRAAQRVPSSRAAAADTAAVVAAAGGTPALRAGFPGCSPWGRNPSPQLQRPGSARAAVEARARNIATPRSPVQSVCRRRRCALVAAPPARDRRGSRMSARRRRARARRWGAGANSFRNAQPFPAFRGRARRPSGAGQRARSTRRPRAAARRAPSRARAPATEVTTSRRRRGTTACGSCPCGARAPP